MKRLDLGLPWIHRRETEIGTAYRMLRYNCRILRETGWFFKHFAEWESWSPLNETIEENEERYYLAEMKVHYYSCLLCELSMEQLKDEPPKLSGNMVTIEIDTPAIRTLGGLS